MWNRPILGESVWCGARGGSYRVPENLGDSINTLAAEIEPWISPDECMLIWLYFSSTRAPVGALAPRVESTPLGPTGAALAPPVRGT
jgi:hypothetical protein